jgi:AraC-like DNA-binding protein
MDTPSTLGLDPLRPGAQVVATQAYTIKTLAIRDDVFVLVLQGVKRLQAPGAALQVAAGEGVMIARGTQWDVTNDPHRSGCYRAVAIPFTPALVGEFAALGAAATVPVLRDAVRVPARDGLREAVLRTLATAPGEEPIGARLLQHRLMEVLLLLAQSGWQFAGAAEPSWADRVRRLVEHRPHATWDARTLAAAFNTSESTLRRRLEADGVALAAFVKEIRLELALGLLQTQRLPIGEVAQHCGWQSHSRFTAAFTERWGATPSEVRARLNEEAQPLRRTG